MFLVQVHDRQYRFSGVGVTIEKAASDLFKHFRPEQLVINSENTRAFHKCDRQGRLALLPEKDMPAALQIVSDAYNQS